MKVILPKESEAFLEQFHKSFVANGNTVSEAFVTKTLSLSKIDMGKFGSRTRVCTITLPTGHECIGKSHVVDAANDSSSKGNAAAKRRAVDEVYQVLGTIAVLFVDK